jgi:hypothetical protein
MSDEKVTPIRPDLVSTKPNPTFQVIETRAEEIRELIFQAQGIIQLAMRAAMANERNPDWTMKNALGTANGLLDEAAAQLEPDAITAHDEPKEAAKA